MIQCCSELPFCMLGNELEANDYDFVLYHQYIHSDTYRENYLRRREEYPHRMMILDNSAYEFFVSGEQFIPDDYVRVINELKPDYYIIPDILMDAEGTAGAAVGWMNMNYMKCAGSGAKPFFTPQGKTRKEFDWCCQMFDNIIRRLGLPHLFCIPFHDEFLKIGPIPMDIRNQVYPDPETRITIDRKYALGRVMLMRDMVEKYPDYQFHLLGSHDPAELRGYVGMDQIRSFDSGYPVKLGVCGVRIGEEEEKPDIIIDDFCNAEMNDETKNLILDNIKMMKSYARDGKE